MNQIFNNGSTVLFQGDSVTDCDRDREDISSLSQGYPGKISDIYKSLFPNCNATFINKGVSGNRTCDLLCRYEQDFKNINPDFISILIGINDVWRRYDNDNPTSCQQFYSNYRQLLTQLKRDLPNTKIMLIEPFLLHTDIQKIPWHIDLDPKIQAVRTLAKEFADYYLPLDGIMTKYSVNNYSESEITADGVHPTGAGHGIIAKEYLRAIGVF